MSEQQAVVVFEELACTGGQRIGVARLNSEKSLNSLNLPMIERLYPQLQRWAEDEGIVAVFVHGAGEKAFCAGGDVKRVCLAVQANGIDDPTAFEFFSAEYRLDYLLHFYPKPVLVWATGIVMGGGIGLLAGASHRIVTENSRLAMPEISIGLYPDVGGSWFLSRLGQVGLFLGMTGASINASDALALGFANHLVSSRARADVLAALTQVPWSEDRQRHGQQLSQLLAQFVAPETAAGILPPVNDEIIRRTTADDFTTLYRQLTEASADVWLNKAAETLKAGSPTSAALIYRQWQNGSLMSLADCFRQELVLSVQCARHPDFIEGVRALLVDKDHQPHWQPAGIEDLTADWLDGHYRAPWTGEHPLADL